jgi:hypothetical protein
VQQLRALPRVEVSVTKFNGDALILIRHDTTCDEIGRTSVRDDVVVIHHFEHGNEGELVDIVKNLSADSELWIVGDDDALGTGALGLAACIIAESPEYTVHSLLFENHDICPQARESIIYSLRQNTSLLEQHLMYTRSGEVFVRRLIYGQPEVKDTAAPRTLSDSSKGPLSYVPPGIKPTDVQVSVRALGIISLSTDKSLVTFVGKVTGLGAEVNNVSVETSVCWWSSSSRPLHLTSSAGCGCHKQLHYRCYCCGSKCHHFITQRSNRHRFRSTTHNVFGCMASSCRNG